LKNIAIWFTYSVMWALSNNLKNYE